MNKNLIFLQYYTTPKGNKNNVFKFIKAFENMHEPWIGWIKFNNLLFMLQNIQKMRTGPPKITWLTRTGEKQQKVIWWSGRSASSYQISFESHGIFPRPFSSQLIILFSISFVDFSYFWNKRIIRVRITQQGAYRQQNFWYC